MTYYNHVSNYDKYPNTEIKGYDNEAFEGYEKIFDQLKKDLIGKKILTVDCYPGVNDEELLNALTNAFDFTDVLKSEDVFYDKDKLNELMKYHLTEDRVRGVMYYGPITDFIDNVKLEEYKEKAKTGNFVLIYGFGASLINKGDVLVYADMTRWEIQLRYRKGMPNYKCDNYNEDNLKKIKRGFFIEWRIADRHKVSLFNDINYYLDTNKANDPKMISSKAFFAGLRKVVSKPFRLVPYFDPGVWGGHWMQEVCNLDKNEKNFAWSFDGVPEENSIHLKYGDVIIDTPAMNLVKYQPKELLGEKNYSRFGAEFPIRFDFLDTMGGQNLSLQVHPTTEYIKTKFGMTYTQDESYYILDAKEDGGVYLGLKEGVDPQKMIEDLESAQAGKISFPAEKYVNLWPAKKHDHFLIPAGTIHCSSSNCMVLEISATPYIFTFKLWDWDRLGLDGLPRPIHIEDGKQVIQWDRTTEFVKKNLVNHFEKIHNGEDYTEVKTGLHELEFIETRVFTSNKPVKHENNNGVNVLNLVDGSSAIVESVDQSFEPFEVHYAETFIIPAKIKEYIIKPKNENEEIKVLKAYVRN